MINLKTFRFFSLSLCFIFITNIGLSQNRASRFQEKYLNKQFWVGVKIGGNLTKAKPIERYSIYASTTDPSTNAYDKSYDNFSKSGGEGALDLSFFYKGFGISFQPGYKRMSYFYSNEYRWTDTENTSNILEQKYESTQKLDYFDFPLSIKYQPLKTKIKPFIQVGIFYSHLNNAYKTTKITTNDNASGSTKGDVTQDIQVGAKDLYIRTNLGWMAGFGASAPVGNMRVAIDLSYRRNTHNITNIKTRYNNDRITGAGDIADDIKLRNLNMSISFLIPMRFIILRENYKTE